MLQCNLFTPSPPKKSVKFRGNYNTILLGISVCTCGGNLGFLGLSLPPLIKIYTCFHSHVCSKRWVIVIFLMYIYTIAMKLGLIVWISRYCTLASTLTLNTMFVYRLWDRVQPYNTQRWQTSLSMCVCETCGWVVKWSVHDQRRYTNPEGSTGRDCTDENEFATLYG